MRECLLLSDGLRQLRRGERQDSDRDYGGQSGIQVPHEPRLQHSVGIVGTHLQHHQCRGTPRHQPAQPVARDDIDEHHGSQRDQHHVRAQIAGEHRLTDDDQPQRHGEQGDGRVRTVVAGQPDHGRQRDQCRDENGRTLRAVRVRQHHQCADHGHRDGHRDDGVERARPSVVLGISRVDRHQSAQPGPHDLHARTDATTAATPQEDVGHPHREPGVTGR